MTHGESQSLVLAPPAAAPVLIDVCGSTSIGRERERNEDQFLIGTIERNLHVRTTTLGSEAAKLLSRNVEGTLLMVADGMGGHGGGDVASAVAVQAVASYLSGVLPWFDERRPGVRDGLAAAFTQGERAIRQAAMQPGGCRDMATTLTVAYLRYPLLYVAHAGDSRCYLLRGAVLHQLTEDHTLAQKMSQRARVPIDERSPWHHVLWNALGGGDQTEMHPDVRRARLEPGDVVLLCSDGLTKHVPADGIAALLGVAESAAAACSELVAAANRAGGSDNITCVVARCVPTRDPANRPISH